MDRQLRQQRAAIPFAARHVEHPLALDPATGERVAMPMLVGNLTSKTWDKAFASEFEVVRHWM
jgi:hypothetical protein